MSKKYYLGKVHSVQKRIGLEGRFLREYEQAHINELCTRIIRQGELSKVGRSARGLPCKFGQGVFFARWWVMGAQSSWGVFCARAG